MNSKNKIHECYKCKDTKKVRFFDPILGERYMECTCARKARKAGSTNNAKIPSKYADFTFDDFTLDGRSYGQNATVRRNKNQDVMNNLMKCVELSNTLRQEGTDILIYGSEYNGKTSLAVALLKEMMVKGGKSGMFITADKLCDLAMEKTKFNADEDKVATFNKLYKVDFLLIDRFEVLMKEKLLPQVKNKLIGLIEKRKDDNKCFILVSIGTLDIKNEMVKSIIGTLINFHVYGVLASSTREQMKSKLIGIKEVK